MDASSMLTRYESSLTFAPSTIDVYTLQVRLFLRWCEETGRDPLGVEDLDFFQYFDVRVKRGLKPRSLDPIRSALKSFYGWLVNAELITDNPVPARAAPHPPNALPATLSVEQLRAVWLKAPSAEHRVLVGLVGICGLLLDEAVAIDVPDCRMDARAPVVRLELQRRGHGRSPLVPISSRCSKPSSSASTIANAGRC